MTGRRKFTDLFLIRFLLLIKGTRRLELLNCPVTSTFFVGSIVWLMVAMSGYGQNIIPTNSSAELGSYMGWDVNATTMGANQAPDPLNSATINTDPLFVTEGTNSFYLHDGSGASSVRLTSSSGNRAPIFPDIAYVLSFDARMIGASAPLYSLVQARFYDTPSDGICSQQMALNLGDAGSFSSIRPTTNGFTKYIFNFKFSSSAPCPVTATRYLELDFWTDFYSRSLSDLYLDNIRVGPQTAPMIKTVSAAVTNVSIDVVNGLPHETYCIMTSTNMGLPLTQWTTVATNACDGAGSFSFTKKVDPNLPLQFYVIKTMR